MVSPNPTTLVRQSGEYPPFGLDISQDMPRIYPQMTKPLAIRKRVGIHRRCVPHSLHPLVAVAQAEAMIAHPIARDMDWLEMASIGNSGLFVADVRQATLPH